MYLIDHSRSHVVAGGLAFRPKVRGIGKISYMVSGPILDTEFDAARPVAQHRLATQLRELASRGVCATTRIAVRTPPRPC
jgi:hypothetical protein